MPNDPVPEDAGQAQRSAAESRQASEGTPRQWPILESVIVFLGIDSEACRNATAIWALIEPHTNGIVERFCAEIGRANPELSFGVHAVERLKARQKEHWRMLFESRFDDRYFSSASLVGIRNRKVGLDLKWYVAGYMKIKMEFARVILGSPVSLHAKTDLVATLDRYVALDMSLAVSSYTAWLVD